MLVLGTGTIETSSNPAQLETESESKLSAEVVMISSPLLDVTKNGLCKVPVMTIMLDFPLTQEVSLRSG
jgi:hypothetical protein